MEESSIRVLVVDDSSLTRSMLRTVLEEDGGFVVIAEAKNGREAVEKARQWHPDLITMDLEMPVMDGLAAIEEIMGSKAIPILVVSNAADAARAYHAVSLGAVDVTNKPGLEDTEIAGFLEKARQTAQVPVITHLRRQGGGSFPPMTAAKPAATVLPAGPLSRVIAIACSTGGPQALAFILSRFPATLPCPIVVAQHMSDGFVAGMAGWLASITNLQVREGKEGDPLEPGVVYLSPSESNMSVTMTRHIALDPCLPGQIYHPSCDALLSGVAKAFGRGSIGVILTGMGSDGARGMKDIRDVGGVTLAQDEGSSLIFGMNAISIERGLIQKVLPLQALTDALIEMGSGRAGSAP